MSSQTWWYLARASGYVAWALVSASLVSGLLVSTRLTKGKPTAAWLVDLHRFLAAVGVTFTGIHILGLVADTYVQFDALDVLVPFVSSWRPGPVALGIVALYLLLAVEISSLVMRRLPRRVWRVVHLSSFVLFWSATFHLLLAGSDAGNVVSQVAVTLVMVTVVFLTLVRVLTPRRADRARPTSSRRHAAATR
jgi:DMSO/TMAO reductase YedYZ heme-binding membrane subunit